MHEELIGLIPAAGRGLRLRLPYPKELYPIIRDNHYKPVSQFVVENLTASGVEHIVFVINETKHQLIGYFGDGNRFGCHFGYVVQEERGISERSTSPGLASALDAAYYQVRHKTVCFGMADTIMTPQDVFRRLLTVGMPDDDVILGVFPTEHPEQGAMVRMVDGGSVIEIIDKPTQVDHQHTWGCIVWRREFTEFLHECIARGIVDFARVMNLAIKKGLRFRGVYFEDGSYTDFGTYTQIAELEKRYRNHGGRV
jgi:glucose-1-phosphate thymidylyltransferase